MPYTLVSMIGTGMYKTSKNPEGYAETDYSFDGGRHFKTRLFMQALLECKYKDINQIILLGTDTSSWDCLIDKEQDDRDETVELWSDLVDQCETREKETQPDGVTRENLDRLQAYLSDRFAVEVLILSHTHSIDNSTAAELFACYSSIPKLCKKGNNILFDITHGFRSMSVLLYQSLQYSLSQQTGLAVEIVYGELDILSRTTGHVRNLSSYWNYSELTAALNIFNTKLDGFKLTELLAPYWEKGGKAIKSFSEIVQTNFALQLTEVLKQIKNALKAYPQNAPEWLIPVKHSLENIAKLEDSSSVAKTLFNYSKFLYGHQMNVQAVITLQVAVESAIIEKYGNKEEYLGDYDWWRDYGKNFLKDVEKKYKEQDLKIPLQNLEHFRNQIAHGGGQNHNGNFPCAANIPSIYESGVRGIEKLFKAIADNA